ncbi:MAG TPA: M15 family metallopeptidase [Actinomycetota bacterium]|nr:M15 family metallopeptidase [Actinomycetota bacterium]
MLLLASCGGEDGAKVAPDLPSGASRNVELPDPLPAVPAFTIDLFAPLPDAVAAGLETIPDVAIVTGVATEEVWVDGPEGSARLRLGSTRPLRFRPVAPPSTKEAEFVWTSLLSGNGIVTFDAAEKLGLAEAGTVVMRRREIPVGAFASNSTPDVVDVLVADHVGRALGLGEANVLVVGAKKGADLKKLGSRLERKLRGYEASVKPILPATPAPVEPVEQPEPVGQAEGGAIGTMSFRILKDGFIDPDPEWVAANIATGEVALLGTLTCHRLVFPQLHAAMTEIADAGLSGEVGDYGGCYVPRFIDRDPNKPLSMHAFGLAFDINVSTNQLGTRGDQHPQVVEILERWGFAWGGRWARPDPMHFEMVRLIEV